MEHSGSEIRLITLNIGGICILLTPAPVQSSLQYNDKLIKATDKGKKCRLRFFYVGNSIAISAIGRNLESSFPCIFLSQWRLQQLEYNPMTLLGRLDSYFDTLDEL